MSVQSKPVAQGDRVSQRQLPVHRNVADAEVNIISCLECTPEYLTSANNARGPQTIKATIQEQVDDCSSQGHPVKGGMAAIGYDDQ